MFVIDTLALICLVAVAFLAVFFVQLKLDSTKENKSGNSSR